MEALYCSPNKTRPSVPHGSQKLTVHHDILYDATSLSVLGTLPNVFLLTLEQPWRSPTPADRKQSTQEVRHRLYNSYQPFFPGLCSSLLFPVLIGLATLQVHILKATLRLGSAGQLLHLDPLDFALRDSCLCSARGRQAGRGGIWIYCRASRSISEPCLACRCQAPYTRSYRGCRKSL